MPIRDNFAKKGKMIPPWAELPDYTERQQWAGLLLGLALGALEIPLFFYLI